MARAVSCRPGFLFDEYLQTIVSVLLFQHALFSAVPDIRPDYSCDFVYCIVIFCQFIYFERRITLDKNINLIKDLDGTRFVLINDIRFKGKREEWKEVESLLKEYVGEFYEIEETCEKVFISSDFPDEFANSESRIRLRHAAAKAKANAAQVIPELIQIATNRRFEENRKEKHKGDAKFGWYRYDVRFALPVYSEESGQVERYNIYKAVMLVKHAGSTCVAQDIKGMMI